jgi:predicted ATPase/DNA-binding CsgD family transcriptional regulator
MEPARQASLAAAGVTARETEVLAVIGSRLTNQEIAERLYISVRTVESHVSALLRKLGLGGRLALIQLAQQLAAERPLPVPSTSFVGRDQDLALLRDLLVNSPLICLSGPAGCGKTRLALEAAREWPAETRIARLGSADAADVSAVIAAALGLSYEAEDVAAAARVALAGRSVLLVADDCDQVSSVAAEQLTALVRAVPGLRVLATSRQPLGVSEERMVLVAPLACPAGSGLAEVQKSEAGRLFADRARAVSSRFRLDEDSAGSVASICRRLDGLPLAIELAATRVRTLDLATLADSLSNHLRLLERPTGTGRHRSLAAAIEWSWQLLDSGERDLLGRLAALPGDFTLSMAQAVTPAQAAASVNACLLRLADRSLISATLAAGQPARYRLLGIIRAYAAEQAPEAANQVRLEHARYSAISLQPKSRPDVSPAPPSRRLRRPSMSPTTWPR